MKRHAEDFIVSLSFLSQDSKVKLRNFSGFSLKEFNSSVFAIRKGNKISKNILSFIKNKKIKYIKNYYPW